MKIAILTAFTELHDGYSLSHVVRNQVEMLTRYGHEVTVFVREDFVGELPGCKVEACIPAYQEIRYWFQSELREDHKAYAETTAVLLTEKLRGFDVIFTHDWIFSSWFRPLAEVLQIMSPQTRDLKFLHWIHSIPSIDRCCWWDMGRYSDNHKIVYPNKTHALQVANLFKGEVTVIPHITDLRTMFEFSDEARQFIDEYPGLMQADFVQVYPAAADRLMDKGIQKLILTFEKLKRKASVCLLVVNSWTGKCKPEDLTRYRMLSEECRLSPKEVGFTSEFQFPKYERCVPRRVLLELMQCSNLFVFPSQGESFGLGILETSLAAGALTVLNGSFPPMREVGGGHGIYGEFGSCERPIPPLRHALGRLADMIYETAMSDEAWKARTFARQTYNMDSIYHNYYEPLLNEGVERREDVRLRNSM